MPITAYKRNYTAIPTDTFDGLQVDAGILLKTFNPSSPSVSDSDIICATTGGINAVCTPTYVDLGEDIDNCPVKVKELMEISGWDCTFGFTALGTDADSIKLALGAATGSGTAGIAPAMTLDPTDSTGDFKDIWWVGDKAKTGGFVAIQLKNALSTGGFSLQTSKGGKGQISVTLTGHVSINAQATVPMVFYTIDA